jgi:sec-independent protein translocase protein TatA
VFTGFENPTHILLLLVLCLLLFGAKRLPEVGRSLGTGMRQFKQSITGEAETTPSAAPDIVDASGGQTQIRSSRTDDADPA